MLRGLVVALLGILTIGLMAWNLSSAPETPLDLAKGLEDRGIASGQNPAQANQSHAGQDQKTIVR